MRPRRSFLRDNGLSLVLIGLFLIFVVGLAFSGWFDHNSDERLHGGPAISLCAYLASADFGEALFENWESEFLQMGLYIVLTAFFYQRGSSESKDPDESSGAPAKTRKPRSFLYRNSLSLAFLALFLFSFAGHAICGWHAYSGELVQHGQKAIPLAGYFFGSRFWFESFQNWQSEFLAVFAIVVLSIWLRQEHSPESKPIDAADTETGK